MSRYTMELKDIVAHENIFDFKYPFYNEEKRQEFEQKFIKHFYFREIGCDTVDRFKHYLRDKFETVFPYYNKLLETTLLEYEITDNYKLTETYQRTVDNEGKTSAISSTVGRAFSNQESNTEQTHNGESNGTSKQNENLKNDETVDTTNNKNVTGTNNGTQQNVEKFLDTPQGKLNLNDSSYLTNLKQNDVTNNQHTTSNDVATGKQTTDGSSVKNLTGEHSEKENATDKMNTKGSQEEQNTSDNNTRAYSNNKQIEQYTIVRKGNIGVDTDSDVILKHLKLQKHLTAIEKNFFDECEDLFMLVY